MGRAKFVLRCRERLRDVRSLTDLLGENPKRPPLDESIIALARREVAQAVGLRREGAEAHHPKSRWKFGLARRLQKLGRTRARTSPTGWSTARLQGSLVGSPRDRSSPACRGSAPLRSRRSSRPPSTTRPFTRRTGKTLRRRSSWFSRLSRKASGSSSRRELTRNESSVQRKPPRWATSGSSARRARATYKNKVVLDLKSNRANELVALGERVVLPFGVGHALDLAQFRAGGHEVWCLTLDFKDAFCWIPPHADGVRFCCADLGDEGFVVFCRRQGVPAGLLASRLVRRESHAGHAAPPGASPHAVVR